MIIEIKRRKFDVFRIETHRSIICDAAFFNEFAFTALAGFKIFIWTANVRLGNV
jgi:hypothetical protein